MKKILLSIVFIFSALWAGLTWFAASKTEDVFNKMLVESNQQLAESTAMLSMQKQSFKKGFISSHAKSIIHIRPELLNDAFAIPLEHEIYHGPLMATSAGLKVGTSYIVTSLDLGALNPEKQGIINQVFAGKQALFSTTQTNFDGSFTEFFEISPLTIDAAIFATLFQLPQSKGSDFNLSLAGIKGEFSSTAKNDYLYANVSTGLLNLSGHDNGENFNLRVAEARVSLDIDELYKGMMLLGRSSLEIPAIHFKSHAGSFSLIDTALTMTMKEQADDYLENFSLEINKIRLKTRKITLPE
ncbi:MAG: DUF945 family protein, partial [Methyloprofundus sp.]|nr:DUF945 family protein [Methyloprofundus sp.]